MSERPERLFLLRHGEVDAAWHGRIYGALDVPLSAGGKEEARRAARRLAGLELGAVVSSGLARTEFGAELLREPRGLPALVDPELRELERGAWAGLTLAELEAQAPGAFAAWARQPAATRSPGGESLTDLAQRVLPRVRHWCRAHAGRDVALVVHGWVVRVVLCEALGLALDLSTRLDVRTGDLFVLRRQGPTGLELESFACDVLPGLAAHPA